MSVVLWIVQILLAFTFGAAGAMKISQPREKMKERMGWVEDFSDNMVKFIGVMEVLGALGLILPAATGILPWLTPLAAVGLILVMIGALITHGRRNELAMAVPVNGILLLLAAFVAWGRFGPYSL